MRWKPTGRSTWHLSDSTSRWVSQTKCHYHIRAIITLYLAEEQRFIVHIIRNNQSYLVTARRCYNKNFQVISITIGCQEEYLTPRTRAQSVINPLSKGRSLCIIKQKLTKQRDKGRNLWGSLKVFSIGLTKNTQFRIHSLSAVWLER